MTVNSPSTFPSHLLSKSNLERLEYFRALTIKHPLLHKAYEELRCAIRDSSPGSIIFIYGPTGVGKTTLLERIQKHFVDSLLPELDKDLERIPIVEVQLTAPSSGSFDWKDYFKRLLLALEEPLIDYKMDRRQWDTQHIPVFRDESNNQLISGEKFGIQTIRFATERTLKRRQPAAILLDDAQHLGIISSGRRLLDQLNTIKSLADKSKITHVLAGTYELTPLRNLNGQLSRRSIDIHFGRYQASNEKHRQEFINILYTFQQHLPLPTTPDLVSRWDYFYERSIGCVGVLKDWLTRSLALALDSSSPSLPLKYVERRALSVPQCVTIFREAKIGEKEIEEQEEGQALLRQELGLLTDEVLSNQEEITANNQMKPVPAKNVARKRRVGLRKPVRDKTGVKVA